MWALRVLPLLFAFSLLLSSVAALAHEPSGQFARIVVIQPKAGHKADFEAGYKRHLLWHKENSDPWTWHGWLFVLGDRAGQFMDGTFGHAVADFDHAIDPKGDAEDNSRNVTPYADFVSHGIYERIDDASTGIMPSDPSPYMSLNTYTIYPGQEPAFEAAIVQHSKRGGNQPMSWYKLKIGGPIAQYLLVRPVQSFAGGGQLAEIGLPTGLVQHAESELLRYQPQMSYAP
jgi:hypothetical protein